MAGIREMTEADCKQLVKIVANIMPHPFDENAFRSCVHPAYRNYVLYQKNTLIGFIITKIEIDECWIINFAIDKPYQRQHFGRQVFEYVLKEMDFIEAFWLEVRASNQAAIQFYKNLGFTEVSIRKNYYRDGVQREDAIIMRRYTQHG